MLAFFLWQLPRNLTNLLHCWELGFAGIFISLSGAFTGRRKARLFEEMPTRGHCEPYQRPRLWRKCFCRKWQPTPVFLPGKFREQRCLVGCSPCGNKESHTTKCTRMNARTHTEGTESKAEEMMEVTEDVIEKSK